MIRTLRYIFMIVVCGSGTVSAGVVVNEVMSNEPGGEVSLEWIELYNSDTINHVNLAFFDLRIHSGSETDTILLAGEIPAGGYLIYCRDLVRFEEHWGDSSGEWGDHSTETYLISERPFQLSNTNGQVELYRLNLQSELSWTESGVDGHSWERFHPTMDEIGQSVDPTGSTPGGINSITPMGVDLALAGVEATSVNGSARLVFEIVNRGLSTVSTAYLDMYQFDENAADSLGLFVASESVGEVDSGFTVMLVGQYQFAGQYKKLIARLRLSNDDRPNNNQFIFVAPGDQYPPVRLSEVQPCSPDPLGSEWVEIENIEDTAIDLSGWFLGDSISYKSISSGSLMVPAGEYFVLVQDSSGFRLEFPLYAGLLHEPESWRELNNGSDSVRLLDFFGVQADRFYYNSNPEDGRTWSRSSTGDNAGEWGRSEDEGGTPGEVNRVRFEPEGTRTLNITVTPQIVSPDGDGRDDSTVIVVNASKASSYVLKLYDSHGRLVKTFEDHSPDLAQSYVWRGRDDGGQKLPIGIYILYFEATGVESIKKTIVLAR